MSFFVSAASNLRISKVFLFMLFLVSVQAQFCPKDCFKCTLASACQECQEGFFISGYLCQKCKEEGCANCPGDTCTKCMEGFNLAEDGTCIDMRSGKKYLIWGLIILFVIVIVAAFLCMWKWKTIHKFFSSFFNELNRVKQVEKSLQDSQSDLSKKMKESKKRRLIQQTCVDDSGLELNVTKKTDEESASGIEKTSIKAPKGIDPEKKPLNESAKDIEKDLNAIELTEKDDKQDPELGKSSASFKLKEAVLPQNEPAKSETKPLISTDSAKSSDLVKDSSKHISEAKILQPAQPTPETKPQQDKPKITEAPPTPAAQPPKPEPSAPLPQAPQPTTATPPKPADLPTTPAQAPQPPQPTPVPLPTAADTPQTEHSRPQQQQQQQDAADDGGESRINLEADRDAAGLFVDALFAAAVNDYVDEEQPLLQ